MARQRFKVLIIKCGYSETLVPQVRRTCSLGDVFRTTSVLHLFKDDHVTWVTDEKAVPLLRGNPYIDRILTFDLMTALLLLSERFDKVINLEKSPGICALVSRINAWSHYGFRFDQDTGEANAFERAYDALAVATRDDVKKLNDRPWAALLFDMLGAKWSGQRYMLGYQPTSEVACDVGFNSHVGSLLPVKAWPPEHWDRLEALCRGKFTVCRQQHLDNLEGYIDWIHSCRMLVTNDSLGLFLGVALDKKVIGLFGPTSATEQAPYLNLRTLVPPLARECMPCCKETCALGDPCIRYITPEQVFATIEEWGVA